MRRIFFVGDKATRVVTRFRNRPLYVDVRRLSLRHNILCRHNRYDPKMVRVFGLRGRAFGREYASNTCQGESVEQSSGR